jgi:hypothetical protein
VISGNCLSTLEPTCEPSTCRWRCAIEVIDELLIEHSLINDQEADDLLDLRCKILGADDAEGTLRLFCAVRRRMERKHYLAFFRIRRWLENNMVANICLYPGVDEQPLNLKLDHYCIEAIRRASLCLALRSGVALNRPRLRFVFRGSRLHPIAIERVDR